MRLTPLTLPLVIAACAGCGTSDGDEGRYASQPLHDG